MPKRIRTPAEVVRDEFGGVRPAALAIGVAPSTVSRWISGGRRGSNGVIPWWWHKQILKAAKRKRVPISQGDLTEGRKR